MAKINRIVKVNIAVLLVLQLALSILLWNINPSTGAQGTGLSALILGADLLAFVVIAHIYRTST